MFDGGKDMEVSQSSNYGEKDDSLNGRIGGMDYEGLEYSAHNENSALNALDRNEY